ncbi:MAG TPA: ribbon-helix-helix domain-containing protein [Alphaproteobacteria bacterium]|nr:ribbon-helix-helix domain-containing protein [Alphaproteobacteria bacterium]
MVSNVPRSVRIGGRRTSMRLETQFWEALRDVAEREHADVGEICTRIAKRSRNANLSSAVRVAMVDYYRELAGRQDAVPVSDGASVAAE